MAEILSTSERLLATNIWVDVRDILATTPHDLTFEDLHALEDCGLEPPLAAQGFLLTDYKWNSFLDKMKRQLLEQARKLSEPQVLATLRIAREQVQGIESDPERAAGMCRECGHYNATLTDQLKHRHEAHGWEPEFGSVEQAIVAPTVVTSSDEAFVPVGDVPRGCYAIGLAANLVSKPDIKPQMDSYLERKILSQGGFVFLKVEYLKKPTHRNRRFVYGKNITGSQMLPAGTLEFRFWESDRKELIGYQEPGGPYVGKYRFLLDMIGENPEAWGPLFAMLKKHCPVCWKSLTDDTSRALGIGPDCEKRWGSLENYYKQCRPHLATKSA